MEQGGIVCGAARIQCGDGPFERVGPKAAPAAKGERKEAMGLPGYALGGPCEVPVQIERTPNPEKQISR